MVELIGRRPSRRRRRSTGADRRSGGLSGSNPSTDEDAAERGCSTHEVAAGRPDPGSVADGDDLLVHRRPGAGSCGMNGHVTPRDVAHGLGRDRDGRPLVAGPGDVDSSTWAQTSRRPVSRSGRRRAVQRRAASTPRLGTRPRRTGLKTGSQPPAAIDSPRAPPPRRRQARSRPQRPARPQAAIADESSMCATRSGSDSGRTSANRARCRPRTAAAL